MRVVLALVGLLAVAHPALAQSPVPLDVPASSAEAEQPSPALASALASPRLQVGRVPLRFAGNRIYCCSEKGAVIGAAIGAGLGLAMVYYFDDSGYRSEHFFTTAAVLGAVGAGLGALTGSPSITRPTTFPVGKHLGVGPVVSRQKTGGAMSVRF
jgi:MFS family permease